MTVTVNPADGRTSSEQLSAALSFLCDSCFVPAAPPLLPPLFLEGYAQPPHRISVKPSVSLPVCFCSSGGFQRWKGGSFVIIGMRPNLPREHLERKCHFIHTHIWARASGLTSGVGEPGENRQVHSEVDYCLCVCVFVEGVVQWWVVQCDFAAIAN